MVPVWSAIRATFRPLLDWISEKPWMQCLALYGLLTRLSPNILDLIVLSISIVIIGCFPLFFYCKNLLRFRKLPLALYLPIFLKGFLAATVARAIFCLCLLGETPKLGLGLGTLGKFVIQNTGALALILFVVLLIVQTKTLSVSITLIQAGRSFKYNDLPGKHMLIDAQLNSGELDSHAALRKRIELEHRQSVYQRVDRLAQFIENDVWFTNTIVVSSLLFSLLSGSFGSVDRTPTFWLHLSRATLGGMVFLVAVSLLSSLMVGMWLRDELHHKEYHQNKLPSRKEMVTAMGSLTVEAVALAGLGLPPGASLAVQVLVQKLYRAKSQDQDPVGNSDNSRCSVVTNIGSPDLICVNVGRELLPYLDPTKDCHLIQWAEQVRAQLVKDLGFAVPGIRFRDNLTCSPSDYSIMLNDSCVGTGTICLNHLLAIGSPENLNKLKGRPTIDPVYRNYAVWVQPDSVPKSGSRDYLFFEPCQVIASHLAELLRINAHEIFDRNALDLLLSYHGKTHPVLVRMCAEQSKRLLTICKTLLQEQVSLRELETIISAFVELHPQLQSDLHLVSEIRIRLAKSICREYASDSGVLHVLVIGPLITRKSRTGLRAAEVAEFRDLISSKFDILHAVGLQPILMAERDVRRAVLDIASSRVSNPVVLCWDEIYPGVGVNILGEVELSC